MLQKSWRIVNLNKRNKVRKWEESKSLNWWPSSCKNLSGNWQVACSNKGKGKEAQGINQLMSISFGKPKLKTKLIWLGWRAINDISKRWYNRK